MTQSIDHSSHGFFGEHGDSLIFTLPEDCAEESPLLDWHAANAKEIKVTHGQERHSITLYLRWAYSNQLETAPLTVSRAGGDSEPDFMIARGACVCGLEESKATSWDYERFTDELLKIHDTPPSNNPDFENFSAREYIGLCVEEEWAELVESCIIKKMGKLKDRYLTRVSECDLLLRDVGATGPMSEHDRAAEFLQMRMAKILKENPDAPRFRKIHIVAESWAMLDVLGENFRLLFTMPWPEST